MPITYSNVQKEAKSQVDTLRLLRSKGGSDMKPIGLNRYLGQWLLDSV